ncbi:putative protein XRI1 [Helianthus annuus]|nr:putative protein XRI1 [Helianthus annuus]
MIRGVSSLPRSSHGVYLRNPKSQIPWFKWILVKTQQSIGGFHISRYNYSSSSSHFHLFHPLQMEHGNNNTEEMWDWKDEDYALQLDVSNSLWNDVRENDDDLSYVFDDTTTPVKSCGDLGYQVTSNEIGSKEMEICSQSKRRRMLHFDDEGLDADVLPLCDEVLSSSFLKFKPQSYICNDTYMGRCTF